MPLPVSQAEDLAKSMASKGISGSISMGKPMEKDVEMPAMDESEGKPDDMQACLSDLSDAIVSGDKASIMSGLEELMDRWSAKDEKDDEALMGE